MGQSKHGLSHSDPEPGPQPAVSTDDGFGGRPPEMRSVRARVVTRVIHVWFVLTRSMTLGVRAACFDAQGRVFLVRHSYVPGWHMPGGGVERGETMAAALNKELSEEGNLELTAPAELFAVYFNHRTSRRDHVAFYRCAVRQLAPKQADREIIEAGFFALDALPEGVTAATRRRLAELAGEAPISDFW
ncbi:MAG: NUDIX domain-containing protein [Hoeflea sp.]|nr:NUDIX domain-containing protein [Alphaproteobacteria bacterium]MBV1725551.1 NUDIX domain-containing protein [Hoeflea sp.]MBU4546942.1 NUDIX domain-containing protein [Alphaproteobacteria bacterium]MBU4551546.1 NUDIX domain-containing protein [Alphaproteobacteria bacterium]MBV1759599.1 NUDIX domain-containing protein [Hoeflea sp.]